LIPPRRSWRVRLTAQAEADVAEILEWSARQFGEAQARRYAETLTSAIEALSEGPGVHGAKARDEIGIGLLTLHAARKGRRGRHFLLFRVSREAGRPGIDVLRVLHDAMDLGRHVDPGEVRAGS
jgi:toxin ParE1/3/4